jgi:prepilin-type N-terminal cleavage/methylation domain-containing protein
MKFHLPFKKKSNGFTLLELLVVISILGLLMAMGAVAFSTAQRKGRDSRRRGDVQVVSKAFEQYYSTSGNVYEDTCAAMATAELLPGGIPTDPQGDAYNCASTASSYCICSELETGGGNATDGNCTYGTGETAVYYCASNLQ